MSNNEIVLNVVKEFHNEILNDNFVIDKSGVKTVEFINYNMKLNPLQSVIDVGPKKTNEKYVEKELQWYLSQSLNIHPMMSDVQIWTQVCDNNGFINSNYGWCIFSENNYNQYDFVLHELQNNPYSRRACMIYNRPSMVIDYNINGRSDYMCTNYVSCFIRNGELIYNIKQRSCDFIYGFFNDFAWHCWVYQKLQNDLKCNTGIINYTIDSFHVYERHFDIISKIVNHFNY
jgi:thymidylate synthase